jgi:hypothetical protein
MILLEIKMFLDFCLKKETWLDQFMKSGFVDSFAISTTSHINIHGGVTVLEQEEIKDGGLITNLVSEEKHKLKEL